MADDINEDSFLWLEDIDSERSLAWVDEQNALTDQRLAQSPIYRELYRKNLDILDSDDRIPHPNVIGSYYYNFWKDKTRPRGILRRTSPESYRAAEPDWETVLDIDQLSQSENTKWVYKGANWLWPDYKRCILQLSPGGGDAVAAREFDLETKAFVEDGFNLPKSKMNLSWIDEDTLYIGADFGEGSMTDSGYPRILKKWRRGTPIEQAETIFEGEPQDISVRARVIRRAEGVTHIIERSITFYTSQYFLYQDGVARKLPIPEDVEIGGLFEGQLILELKSDWAASSQTFPQGSIVSADLKALADRTVAPILMVAPERRSSNAQVSAAQSFVLVNRLENIRNTLYKYRFANGRWSHEKVDTPEHGTFSVSSVRHDSNAFFLDYEDYLTPDTLYYVDEQTERAAVKSAPAYFDSSPYQVEQLEAESKDGTSIPYFLITRKDLQPNGTTPTLLYGYGGFEIALQPRYNPSVGVSWLDQGGAYAVANIRGGGEFGPSWHRAALKVNRQRAYDDFAAVSEDLIRRGITSPRHLGISGGSNGGLLVGVLATQRPELYNAVVCTVPLLDMKRYNKLLAGASWVAEYGNPDLPEEWAFISRYSPYQNLDTAKTYPEIFFYTSTRDDRVHPGHARKMAAKMHSMGKPTLYYENIEGGHAGSSTNSQTATRLALTYAYLLAKLSPQ